ncbi:M28 family peptidase [Bythopirellula polymerisocia]|uniref:Aminopeptidase YwaD n=1 Tax=Bythopirellula polymerisocia TaxID=2528003 RepID=A0A5C6CS29_9BACT|nr:M28 family peptidase [Bythopirellula polymerisocia]TWU25619.1 Aminopeptidase YwaD precursor [Bythopirellula polymerisocia]
MKFFSIAILTASILTTLEIAAQSEPPQTVVQGPTSFNGKRSYEYLRQLCDLGNRMSGSPGMQKQQELLAKHFEKLGGQVTWQRFSARHPITRQPVPMANLIVQWNPESKERILLCAHYDTRPLPSQDLDPRQRREGLFLGANDGASGTAVLMELAHHIKSLPDRYGLDFVLFDAEEMVYSDRTDPYFLGSEYFAREYRKNERDYSYVAGVLLDMVGDAKLSIYQERNSVAWDDTRPIVQGIWETAARLGVNEFIPQVRYEVRDDHLPLHNIGGIPVCDVIDFEYPDRRNSYWHTTADTPGRCSADSLGKVGLVMLEWLRSAN